MMHWIPASWQPAALQAERFEALFWYIVAVTTVVGLMVYGAMLYFCIVYRRGATTGPTPRILGSHRMEIAWTVIPLVVFLTFFAWGASVYNNASHAPADSLTINVIGKQWMWKAQYPAGQRVIIGGNPDNMTEVDRKKISSLVVPVDKPVQLRLISEDVIHDFGVPAFRSKVDVLPGRYTFSWYHPTKVGEYNVFCDQYCGTWHSMMVGKVRVVPQAEFEEFLRGITPAQSPVTGGPVDGSPAAEGQQLFRKLQCISCHVPNAEAGSGAPRGTAPRAPSLERLYGQVVPLKGGGTAVVNDDYIVESILNPRAKVHEPWDAIMPSFHGQVSAEELNNLVAYIQYLQKGRVLPPNEQFPVPDGAPRQPMPPTTPPSSPSSGGKP